MDNSTQTPAPTQSGWYKATVYRRFAAVFLDGLIMLPIGVIFVLIVRMAHLESISFLQYFIAPAYAIYFIWKYGATLGKKWMKVKVVRVDGKNLSLIQAILRELVGKWISGAVIGLGYWWAFWDKNRQGWHDKIAGTYVVTQKPNDGKNGAGTIALGIIGAILVPLLVMAAIFLIGIAAYTVAQRSAAGGLQPRTINTNTSRTTNSTKINEDVNSLVNDAMEAASSKPAAKAVTPKASVAQ